MGYRDTPTLSSETTKISNITSIDLYELSELTMIERFLFLFRTNMLIAI